MKNYTLNTPNNQSKNSALGAIKKLLPLLKDEKRNLILASIAIFFNSGLNLLAPVVIGYTIDHYVQTKEYSGVLMFSSLLLGMYVCALVASYIQTKIMGGVGQRVLFNLRNSIFTKLQELPVAFFNQNKAGDLISRINNDTDKLNQFFSQSLMQFIGSVFIMIGAGVFLLVIHVRIGAASLAPALVLLIFTQAISAWVKRKNAASLQSVGGMSAEIQESLNNFKVIVAFNRRDYFKKKFNDANEQNYTTAVGAGVANNIFTPVFGLCASVAQLIVLSYGIYLIAQGNFTIGLLISFLSYVNNFYNPLRQLAALWANFQVALAGYDRIADILSLTSDLEIIPSSPELTSSAVLEFKNVSFGYAEDKQVLKNITFTLEKGKTYALVGPTGGGKTTTASLMARLYDPSAGAIYLNGQDIRSFSPEERTKKIGFILQEPFLFNGTVRDNLVYGYEKYKNYSTSDLEDALKRIGLDNLLSRFPSGLETPVLFSGNSISLGQRQIIAFMRSVLREPELLILDEATANIDTVTEQLLEEILTKLPAHTTRVVIAHRLNTIENADEIFFINNAEVTKAGSMQSAVNMLLQGKRAS